MSRCLLPRQGPAHTASSPPSYAQTCYPDWIPCVFLLRRGRDPSVSFQVQGWYARRPTLDKIHLPALQPATPSPASTLAWVPGVSCAPGAQRSAPQGCDPGAQDRNLFDFPGKLPRRHRPASQYLLSRLELKRSSIQGAGRNCSQKELIVCTTLCGLCGSAE